MKIIYNKNPLNSIVELSEKEKKELWYKIKISEMENLLFNAHFHLEEGEHFNLEAAKKSVNADYYCTDEESPLDKRCNLLLNHYLIELKSFHCGDCTCFAATCSKCHAETFLGIDTIKGLSKNYAIKIQSAFGPKNERTIDEAIESLANFKVNPENFNTDSWKKLGGYEQYVPLWKEEASKAKDWLVKYKNEFLTELK